jgi:hypothetical protein
MGCNAADRYFRCAGEIGTAAHQGGLFFTNREITGAKSRVSGSLGISTTALMFDGIPFVAGTYKICRNDDQSLWFSPSGGEESCADKDIFDDMGVMNKVSGKVVYHVGDFLAILNCKPARKMG